MNRQASETRNSPSCGHLILHFHLQTISLYSKYIGVVSQSRKECFSVKDSRVGVNEESVGCLKYLSCVCYAYSKEETEQRWQDLMEKDSIVGRYFLVSSFCLLMIKLWSMVQSTFIGNVWGVDFRTVWLELMGFFFDPEVYHGKRDSVGPSPHKSNQFCNPEFSIIRFWSTWVQVDIGQVTLGHMHPKNSKFFHEYLLVLLRFRETFHYSC